MDRLLGHHDMAFVAAYADKILSDKRYQRYTPWHYVDIDADKRYAEDPVNPKGDVIQGITYAIALLRDVSSTTARKAFFLKLLIHLVGDLHQPLHVGHASDLGGNLIELKWFGQKSNLHRVWDEDMIDRYGMSYMELARSFPTVASDTLRKIQRGSVLDWAYESKRISETVVYPSVRNQSALGYRYTYRYFPILRRQLERAAYRLTYVLNAIYAWLRVGVPSEQIRRWTAVFCSLDRGLKGFLSKVQFL